MSNPPIPPALTEDEWEDIKRPGMLYSAISNAADGCTLTGDSPKRSEATSWHACAALCLYDQPFGFDQRDVRFLLAWAEDTSGEVSEYSSIIFRGLADRISALLPPPPE